jgi:NAD(P)H-hydrate epimerase
MASVNDGLNHLIGPVHSGDYTIGIGPGIGQHEETASMLEALLKESQQPMVLDADALNILAKHRSWIETIPKHSILTPHPKEFERLTESPQNDEHRLDLLRELAAVSSCYIVLKGAYTAIGFPDGTVHFNPSGNPGMATAGSGDVLTGVITGLLAQGYSPEISAVLGVYLHGLAGDIAAMEQQSMESVIASDIIASIGKAYAHCRNAYF